MSMFLTTISTSMKTRFRLTIAGEMTELAVKTKKDPVFAVKGGNFCYSSIYSDSGSSA
jgi:hypothetical protein